MKAFIQVFSRFLLVLSFILILFSFAMFQGDFVSWFLFFAFLPIFLYQIGLFLYPIKGWKVSRRLSSYTVRAGNDVTVKLKIARILPFPLFYCTIEEIFPQSLQKIDTRQEKYHHIDHPIQLQINRKMESMIFPWFKRTIEIPYIIERIPRGDHHLQAIRIKTGDLFGFLKKEYTFWITDSLTVYPNEPPLRLHEQFSNFQQGSLSSYALNVTNTNVTSGIREYLPGDKFSRIDWKQTAKKNTMMTKEFEQEKSTDAMLVLDACYYEGSNALAFEAAVEITISLMTAIHKQSSRVGLITIGKDAVQFPPHHNMTKEAGIRQHLTQIQPEGDRPFAVQLKEVLLRVESGLVLMIITNRLDESLRQSLKELKQRTKHMIVFYIQSTTMISQKEVHLVSELQMRGVRVSVLTEKQLVTNPIEVDVT